MSRQLAGEIECVRVASYQIDGSPSAIHIATYEVEFKDGTKQLIKRTFPHGVMYEVLLDEVNLLNALARRIK